MWNIKPPKPLPEFPQLTSIRHWSLVLLGCHLHSYLVSTSNWELPIGCWRPYQFIIRQMQAQSDTSNQISLMRHEKPLQKIGFPYTQVMVNKVANPRNIKRQGWWWYHLVTGRSRKPPILPYLNLSTIANLPIDSFFHYLLSCQDATPCIRGITTQLCLDEITVRKILRFEHSVQQGLPSHLQPPPLLGQKS